MDEEEAVLVRPDGHVVFRCSQHATDPVATIQSALQSVLGGKIKEII